MITFNFTNQWAAIKYSRHAVGLFSLHYYREFEDLGLGICLFGFQLTARWEVER